MSSLRPRALVFRAQTTCGPGCISQNVTCNGATDNPLLCATCVGANNCKCRAAGARCDGTLQCVDNTTCRSPSAPPLGCEGCECKADFQSPCEFGLVCRDGVCQALDRGCAGCVCEADSTCNLGLKCGGIKVCVFASPEGNCDSVPRGHQGLPLYRLAMCCGRPSCRAAARSVAPWRPDESEAPEPDNQVAIIVGASIGAICCVLLAAGVIFGIFWWSRRDRVSTSNYDPTARRASFSTTPLSPIRRSLQRSTHAGLQRQ
jgi:hypothetical protein